MIFSLKTRYYAGKKGFLPAAIFSLLCLWSITPNLIRAQSGHLSFVPVVNNCTAYVDMPLVFSQPDTSDVGTISFEFNFNPGTFQDSFFGPNDARNLPGILRGISLQGPWGSHFPIIVSRAEEDGMTLPGRWKVEIMSDGVLPGMKIPNGELLRIRFYPHPWVTPGGYEIAFTYGTVNFFSTIGFPVTGLAVRNGAVTIVTCVYTTTTTVLSTTTTTTHPTTTTLGWPTVHVGTVLNDCGGLYTEVPVYFSQPETTSVVSLAVEFDFRSDIFFDQYFGLNHPDNLPQIVAGSALTQGTVFPYTFLAQPSVRLGVTVPGAWTIFVLPAYSPPYYAIPSGELFRVRLVSRVGAPLGVYPLTISPYSAFYDLNGIPIHGLKVQSGQIYLRSCSTQ